MRFVWKNFIALFWGAIYGLVFGYIASQLEQTSVDYTTCAVLGAVLALIFVNVITYITSHANPTRNSDQ
ncbi:YjzD family protein [Limosilactobacillus equigenerosi]|uniref:DUF2929 family protein n=1 Tax=Limosilactobacillus equigenerosi DSM 18793 = JCM 14505 TaxID=1423742 RepID=A0A0R1UPZ2_9LACO|nr:YjzD family protein [Limosilactobacillus equigenerosi]KRL92978.1 hypothetical protein FC21_GL000079 [Limosilactobacillus equigenerosi DSM 18793 = JCM 14505]